MQLLPTLPSLPAAWLYRYMHLTDVLPDLPKWERNLQRIPIPIWEKKKKRKSIFFYRIHPVTRSSAEIKLRYYSK